MNLTNTTTLITDPVTLDEAKQHLRITHSDEDAYIASLLIAAYQVAQDFCQCIIPLQTFEGKIDRFPCEIRLPRDPVVSVESIKYFDTSGVETTLDPSAYHLSKSPLKSTIKPAYNTSWPDTQSGFDKVTIAFTAGYAEPPENMKAAIKLIIGELYMNREQSIVGTIVARVPLSAEYLLSPFKSYSV